MYITSERFVGTFIGCPSCLYTYFKLKGLLRLKEINIGKTKIIIHSKLASMDPEQQKTYFEEEWENNNPVLINIVDAAYKCVQNG
jgi:hypothetical protein